MSGNTPPAGGFGGAPPSEAGKIVQLSGPKPSKHVSAIAFAVILAAMLGGSYYFGWGTYRLAMYGQGRDDLRSIEVAVNDTYRSRGVLCPSTSTLPTMDESLPAEVPYSAFSADPGWFCLGWRPSKRNFTTRLRMERVGTDRVILTSGNNYSRGKGPVHWVARGVLDEDTKRIEFDDIEEELGP